MYDDVVCVTSALYTCRYVCQYYPAIGSDNCVTTPQLQRAGYSSTKPAGINKRLGSGAFERANMCPSQFTAHVEGR
jgi:hypothetical protein